MKKLFKIIPSEQKEGEEGVSIGLAVQIAGREVFCPVTGICRSTDELASEIGKIQEDLARTLEAGKRAFTEGPAEEEIQIGPDMSREEVWDVLSKTEDENRFVGSFNGLDETSRRDLAEYVLTECSVFSGKGAVFSARYDQGTGLMK